MKRLTGVAVIGLILSAASSIAAQKTEPKKSDTSAAASDKKGAKAPPVISPDDAMDHVAEEVIVEMKVESSHNRDANSPCFINSRKNYRDNENFTVIIFPDGLARFKKAKIDDPALHYYGKQIRVAGKIELHNDKPQIKVLTPKQIEIVEHKAKAAKTKR